MKLDALLLQRCHLTSSPPGQNGRHFADDIFNCIFLNVYFFILIKISLKYVPKGPINNIPALVQIMAWRRPGDKPLSGPMLLSLNKLNSRRLQQDGLKQHPTWSQFLLDAAKKVPHKYTLSRKYFILCKTKADPVTTFQLEHDSWWNSVHSV